MSLLSHSLRARIFPLALLAGAILIAAATSLPQPALGKVRQPPKPRGEEPVVTITPGSRVVTTSTIYVEAMWCQFESAPYLDSFQFFLNEAEITSQFSYISNGNQSLGCEMWTKYGATLTIPEQPGDYVVEARARGSDNAVRADFVQYVRPFKWQQVIVVADQSDRVVTASSSGNTQKFVVWNAGLVAGDYSLAASCTPPGAGSCILSPTTLSGIAPGDSGVATVTFTAGSTSGQAGVIRLVATDQTQLAPTDTAWVDVKVESAAAEGVAIVRSLGTTRRSACTTVALGADASMECGDLRVTHPLPSVRSMGKTWTPTLIYSAQQARPTPVVQAQITLPCVPTTAVPDTVEARVYVTSGGSTVQRGFGHWLGSDWGACGSTRHVSIPVDASSYQTWLYDYYVSVTYKGGPATTVNSSVEKLAVVNRAESGVFDSGWWLVGLEELRVIDANTRYWIGGDGSTAIYSGSGSVFVAAALDRPDTITYNASNGEHTRHLAGGGAVKFNSAGYHVTTTNRQGQQVLIEYRMGGPALYYVRIPVRSGTPLYYIFYNIGSGVLDSIDTPGPTGDQRLRITRNGYQITTLRDPDSTTVSFSYGTGANSARMKSRTNRRGYTTEFLYDAQGGVSRVAIPTGGDSAITAVRPAETIVTTNALPVDSVYTRIDGPRSDVADITRIWVNQFGQPTRVRDGAGGETVLRYDARWPGLVSETRSPSRLRSRAFHDSASALLDSTHVYGPNGGSDTARTRYLWDATWRAPIRVIGPMEVKDTMAYDSYGNRTFVQTGGSGRRVNFTYTSDHLDSAVALPSSVGSPVTRMTRNALGNVATVINAKGYVSFALQNAIGQDTMLAEPFSDTTNAASFSTTYYKTVTRRYSRAGRDSVTITEGPSVVLPSPYSTTVSTSALTIQHGYDAEGNRVSTRRSFVYDGVGATLIDSAIFDAANRLTSSMTPASGRGYTLDPAGNVTGLTNGRGYTVLMKYDRANRLIRKIIPQVTADSIPCTATGINWPEPMGCGYYMPTVGGAVCIDADTAYYDHDGGGRLRRAYNRYARIARSHYPSGMLKTETQGIRTYYEPGDTPCHTAPAVTRIGGAEFTSFGTTHTYDLAGNRTGLETPWATGCSSACSIGWKYSPATGLLDTVTTENAGTTTFTHDDAGRLTTIGFAGTWTDARTLDSLGQITARTVSGNQGMTISDALAYDPAGRIKRATVGYREGAAWGGAPTNTWYNAHGAVVAASGVTNATGGDATELFIVDAIGNRRYTRTNNLRPQGHSDVHSIRAHAVNNHGQLVSVHRDTTTFLFDKALAYDASANLSQTRRTELDYYNGTNLWEATKYWYAADDKLAILNRAVGPLADDETHPGEHTVYEEYRYDALGRRVGTRKRMAWSCSTAGNSECASTWTRTVWDGDQVLLEVRAPGHTNVPVDSMEATMPTGVATAANPYGRVGYVHAAGIDQPLAVVRMGLTGAGTSDPYVVYPHANWRGQYEAGVRWINSSSTATMCYRGSTCVEIGWPGATTSVDGARQNPASGAVWFGSLITGNTDGSGMSYLRNRYYDPATGRFTQEDPIGLSGGMNLYGFAGGDRVNFGDPFGLCPPEDAKTGPECQVKFVGISVNGVFGTGVVGAVGMYTTKQGSGFYGRFGGGVGLDLSVGLEGGVSDNLNSFGGEGEAACGGFWVTNGCAGSSRSGNTASGGVAIGPTEVLPVSAHAEKTATAYSAPRQNAGGMGWAGFKKKATEILSGTPGTP